jgi:hypothetical protein
MRVLFILATVTAMTTAPPPPSLAAESGRISAYNSARLLHIAAVTQFADPHSWKPPHAATTPVYFTMLHCSRLQSALEAERAWIFAEWPDLARPAPPKPRCPAHYGDNCPDTTPPPLAVLRQIAQPMTTDEQWEKNVEHARWLYARVGITV